MHFVYKSCVEIYVNKDLGKMSNRRLENRFVTNYFFTYVNNMVMYQKEWRLFDFLLSCFYFVFSHSYAFSSFPQHVIISTCWYYASGNEGLWLFISIIMERIMGYLVILFFCILNCATARLSRHILWNHLSTSQILDRLPEYDFEWIMKTNKLIIRLKVNRSINFL